VNFKALAFALQAGASSGEATNFARYVTACNAGYETADSHRGDIEYGAPVGGIRMVDDRDYRRSQQQSKSDDDGNNFLIGIATNYWKVHSYKGHLEVFSPQCFDRAIASADKVGLWINHDINKVVKFGVELYSDPKSLIFRAAVPS
jgi:hypothetical protein